MSSFDAAVAGAPVGRVLGRGSRIAHCSALEVGAQPLSTVRATQVTTRSAFLRADVSRRLSRAVTRWHLGCIDDEIAADTSR